MSGLLKWGGHFFPFGHRHDLATIRVLTDVNVNFGMRLEDVAE